jgi:phage tail sheath protein FI
MPVTPTYPGVYIEEVPSGVRTITPVATGITAFIGGATRGLSDDPVRVQSFAEFERKFGGLNVQHPMSYAVAQYFENGGSDALIVRVTPTDAVVAVMNAGGIPLEAASKGEWGNWIRVRVDLHTKDEKDPEPQLFNLFAYDRKSRALEVHRNLSRNVDDSRYVGHILSEESELIRLPASASISSRPGATGGEPPANTEWFDDVNNGATYVQGAGGVDGGAITELQILGSEADKQGIYALEKADLFNMLVLPPTQRTADISSDTYKDALAYCSRRRAMLIIDAPSAWQRVDSAENLIDNFRSTLGDETRTKNAAMYFPRIKSPDRLKEFRLVEFAPSGAIAGIYARTDVARGVWKAPAGIEAGFTGVHEFSVKMTDPENGRLNPLAINCLRSFPVYGNVVWGARTMAGSDAQGSEHKYIPVRRLTLFLEESLYRGTQWVVFEPNDEPLWAQIRLNVGAFMNDLFRQGAFQGRTPNQAYFV